MGTEFFRRLWLSSVAEAFQVCGSSAPGFSFFSSDGTILPWILQKKKHELVPPAPDHRIVFSARAVDAQPRLGSGVPPDPRRWGADGGAHGPTARCSGQHDSCRRQLRPEGRPPPGRGDNTPIYTCTVAFQVSNVFILRMLRTHDAIPGECAVNKPLPWPSQKVSPWAPPPKERGCTSNSKER